MLCKGLGSCKIRAIHALPHKTQVLLAKAGLGLQTQPQAQLRVVAQFGVRIERQVVGKQIDIVRQQQRQPLLHPAGDAPVLSAPEQAMVDKNSICLRGNRRLDQGPAGGDAGDDFSHAGPAFHLQAVGAIVTKAPGFKQGVKSLQKLSAVDHGMGSSGGAGKFKGELACACTVLSQPRPAAIQRFAKRAKTQARGGTHALGKLGSASCNTSFGAMTAPQRYWRASSCQRSATQAPRRLRDKTMPSGQGSSRQHTPQPLQGAPHAGLALASGRINMTWCELGMAVKGDLAR